MRWGPMGFRPTGPDLFGLSGLFGLWPAGKDVADEFAAGQPHGKSNLCGFIVIIRASGE